MNDSEGMYLLIETNGSKLWRLNYHVLGRYRTYAMGRYPEVTLQKVRDKKLEARRLIAEGIDSSEKKKMSASSSKMALDNKFRSLAEEYIRTLENKGYVPQTIDKNR
ncbi:Arm DNA-binding domain-containing protein [Azospirillum doebereinerae]|uniref:Arm DNA-binding domain-containing protein n=1 Tax=Azospirillum doebereinerae TaxID=92933 RepID=UPI00384F46F7